MHSCMFDDIHICCTKMFVHHIYVWYTVVSNTGTMRHFNSALLLLCSGPSACSACAWDEEEQWMYAWALCGRARSLHCSLWEQLPACVAHHSIYAAAPFSQHQQLSWHVLRQCVATSSHASWHRICLWAFASALHGLTCTKRASCAALALSFLLQQQSAHTLGPKLSIIFACCFYAYASVFICNKGFQVCLRGVHAKLCAAYYA